MRDVVFIGHSEQRGRKRTAAVLDRYARRIGPDTWCTPITQEGLDVVRKAFARVCTRQVSVSCFWQTPAGLEPAWSIGRALPVRMDGSVPVHEHQRPPRPLPYHGRVMALLARASGLAHDLGKAGADFQKKLVANTPTSDPVRHEWLSYLLLQPLLDGASWQQAWDQAKRACVNAAALQSKGTVFDRNATIESVQGALSFLVATHHRLPRVSSTNHRVKSPGELEKSLTLGTFFNLPKQASHPTAAPTYTGDPQHALALPIKGLQSTVKRLTQMGQAFPPGMTKDMQKDFWFALCLLTRPLLILADHTQSAVDHTQNKPPAAPAKPYYANTRAPKKGGARHLNQLLDWHLNAVGSGAERLVQEVSRFVPPGLSEDSLAKLLMPAPDGPYAWQNRVGGFLANRPKQPTLMMNLAGTGSGKTRMNMRALAEIAPETHSFRVASALNLRTLTLQTVDAYRFELGLDGEVAGVIGDRIAKALHESTKSAPEPNPAEDEFNEDDNPVEEEFITQDSGKNFDPPEWLHQVFGNKKKSHMESVIMAPVVACTADFLVTAGDLPKQGNQAIAHLRLMTSDLILDEVDGYDPQSLVSILRMVTLSALSGRSVITSSATLSEACATAIFQAWTFGIRLRATLLIADGHPALPEGFGQVILFDNTTEVRATNLNPNSPFDFKQVYREHVSALVKTLKTAPCLRLAELISPLPNSEGNVDTNAWKAMVSKAARSMHARHAQAISEKQVSVGLIRVANIKHAIELSCFLAKQRDEQGDSTFRVACYHAGHSRLQRHYIEKELDRMLRRKATDETPDPLTSDPGLLAELKKFPNRQARFVVVATPVEEIGRDHDFDWAIIEPSSTQSLVQTAGRVNRHRQRPLKEDDDHPNVAIMEYPWRGIQDHREQSGQLFKFPGLDVVPNISFISRMQSEGMIENDAPVDPQGSMAQMLSWDSGKRTMRLDASLKFEILATDKEKHPFSALDNWAMTNQLSVPTKAFAGVQPGGAEKIMWFCHDFYDFYRLRPQDAGKTQASFEINPIKHNGRWDDVVFHAQDKFGKPENVSYKVEDRPSLGKDFYIEQRVVSGNDWLVLDEERTHGLMKTTGLKPMDAHSIPTTVHNKTNAHLEKTWHASFGLGPSGSLKRPPHAEKTR